MAIDTRVSTYSIFQTSLNSNSRIIAQLADLQNQLSSGFKSQNFAGIADQATQYLQLKDKLSRTESYITNNGFIKVRMDTTNTVLSQIIETGTELESLIQQRRNQSLSEGTSFATLLNNTWQTLAVQLNTSINGRYLFSGSSTDTVAVDAQTFPTLQQEGIPDDGYYLGNDQDLVVRPDDNVSFVYNVRANAPAFQKIFAGLAMAQLGDQTNDDARLEQAYNLVQEGVQGVINIQTQVNANTVTINDINDNLASLKVYWLGVTEDIVNTDFLTVSTQVAINEGLLQASFQAFARITSLRLSDYLR